MPVQIDRSSAFNFLSSFDDVLPTPDGSIDVNNRAHLWGAYLLEKSYLEVLAETVNINEAILRFTEILKLANELINIILIGDSNITINHEAGDFGEYDTPPDCGEIVTPGFASTYMARIFATSITPGVKTFSAPTGVYFSIDFQIDMSCFTLQDTAWHVIGVRLGDGGSNDVLWTEITSELPDSTRVVAVDDNAATQTGSTIAIDRATLYTYLIKVYKASSAAALDGRIEFWLNGALVDTLVGLDLYDQLANLTQVEVGLMDAPGMDGYIDIDNINITSQTNNAIYILRTIVTKIVAEIVNVSESLLRLPSLVVKIITETVNVVSSYIAAKALQVAETVNISETNAGYLGLIKILAEAVNVNGALLYVLGLFKVISETVNIDTVLVRLSSFPRVINETININAGIVRLMAMLRLESELIRVFETKIKASGFVRVGSDVVNISETNLIRRAITQVTSETINIVSSVLHFIGILRIADETINVSESASRLSGLLRWVNETVNVVEGIIAVRVMLRVKDELIRVFETKIKASGFAKVINETINIVSAVVDRIGAILKIVNETINVVTSSIRRKTIVQVLAEVVNVVSGIIGLRGLIRIITNQVTIVSSILRPMTLIRRTAERLRIFEVVAPVRALLRLVNETVNIISSLLKFKAITQIISSAINIIETVSGTPILYTLIGVAKTGVRITNSIRGVVLKVFRAVR